MMKRKISLLLTTLLLLPVLVFTVGAEEMVYVIDHGALLTDSEEAALQSAISDLRDQFGMDIVILTESTLNGKRPQDYADDYYDNHGYGEDGLLFLLSMEERDWYISTCGDARFALTDYGIQQLGESVLPYLADGDYYRAFATFLGELPGYFDALSQGKPVDGYADYSGDYYHGDQEDVLYYEEPFEPSFFVAIILGIVAGGITVLVMGIAMNTKRPQRSAAVYMDPDSYRVTEHQDLFLYSTVSKVKKPENPPRSGGGGGGSSVHTSSSGISHGGGGGKF